MQSLGIDLSHIKKQKMRMLEINLEGIQTGVLFECPICHYISKNKRFSAKMFEDEQGRSFKCFACSSWRKLR